VDKTHQLFDAVEQRAVIYMQTLEFYHECNITDDEELMEAFLIGVALGSMSAVEVFSEEELFEAHTGPEYDYLYEESDDGTIEE
jgi:hypothetical protein